MIKRIADRLFRWYCHPDFYPDIKGDLEELYADHLTEGKHAQLKYLADVILLFRLSLIRPLFKTQLKNDSAMFKNYLKISVRHLTRHKMYTAINVLGLAIGLASFLLINEYVRFEKSYDSHYAQADQLYRVSYVSIVDGVDGTKDAMASYLVGELLHQEVPEVQQHTVTKKLDPITFKYKDKRIKDSYVISADSSFLKMFDYKVISGSAETMLSEPLSVVLTESRARAFFGDEDPIGKTLQVVTPYQTSVTVTGVIEDVPHSTHYRFSMMISDKTLQQSNDYKNWSYNNYYVYVQLPTDVDLFAVHEKADTALSKFSEFTRLDIHPVEWIHLNSDFTYEPQQMGNKQAVSFLSIISIIILIIAWVNYTNLSTAKAVDRAKEVGLRKVIGAFRRQLVYQFLFEAFLVNLFGAVVALALAELLLPLFNQLIGAIILDHVWNHPPVQLSILAFWVAGSLLSGFYPALVLSGFRPITVLKGKFQNSKSGSALRKGLVVVQFTASLVLIASTMTIYMQVNYMKGRDLGISIENVVTTELPAYNGGPEGEEAHIENLRLIKNKLSAHSSVESVGAASNLPGGPNDDINSTTTTMRLLGFDLEPVESTTYVLFTDDGFMEALDIEFAHGRNYDARMASDSNAIVVNQAFINRFNLDNEAEALGAQMEFWGQRVKIVGIIKDFNRTSLKQTIEPTIYLPQMNVRNIIVELDQANYLAGIDYLTEVWEEFFPDYPLDLVFLDDRFNSLYEQDKRFGNVFIVFSVLAIFIGFLGLYGLSSFLSIQRSKEIGVRVVLGATQGQILYLLYQGFLYLIGFSALVGFPLVYFFMDAWLSNYAYRIDFPWITLAVSMAVVVALAFFTVTYQALKVASLDPAKTLKYE